VRAEVPPNPTRRSRTPDVDYDDYDSGRPRRRGQIFSGLVVLLALAAAALTYYLTYQTLASVRVTSGDGLGGVGGQVMSLVGVLFGALVVFVLALIALVIARPKALAGLGLAASLLLPVAALVLGLWYGGAVLRQNVESEIAQAGPEVAAQGAAAVADAIVQELENRGIDAGPVRDLIRSAVGSCVDTSAGALVSTHGWESACDVVLELGPFGLQQVDARLHQVADADDAGQLTVHDDGEVPEPPGGHDCREVADVVVRAARGDLGGHDVGHRGLEQPRSTRVQPPHDVPLGDDADEVAAVDDRQRTHVVGGQLAEELGDGGIGPDRRHGGALVAQYVRDPHPVSPISVAGRRRR
jgi:hypothetical protein